MAINSVFLEMTFNTEEIINHYGLLSNAKSHSNFVDQLTEAANAHMAVLVEKNS